MTPSHVDVLIVGAGISGIGAAYHLQTQCPDRSYAILEARETLGGTWDLFRYPGVRSDSDMYTLGYAFKPWTASKAIADGPSILEYLRETAQEHGIASNIRYRHRVERASWSSAESRWTVEVERGDATERARLTCNFLFMCSGYYDYANGYTPELPGADRFRGRIVHPQQWTPDIDYADKRVVVIGSGATAVTLVPEMAKKAAHVIMLQRSPSYVAAAPDIDRLAERLRVLLPWRAAYAVTRWKNVLLGRLFFWFCRRYPERAKAMLIGRVRRALGADFDVERHFTPSYDPWDQRLCLVPNGDLFEAIRSGRASVVTDHIDTFSEEGIALRGGERLDADLIVTATGLNLKVLGGVELSVDGARVDLSRALTYKGMMFSDVPNLALSMGYTNASWTLKADLTSAYVCRLLNHMSRSGFTRCCPRLSDPDMTTLPFLDFSSGYVRRAMDRFPKQGSRAPWKLHQNYLLDLVALGYAPVEDEAMEFSPPSRGHAAAALTG